MFQLQSQNDLIAKDSNVPSSKNFASMIGALSALPVWFQKRPFWANFDPYVGDPSCQYDLLIFTEHIPGEE